MGVMRWVCILILWTLICGAPRVSLAETDVSSEFFEAKIRPLLVRRCLRCHGPKTAQRGLRVDSRPALLRGGESGPAIKPGHPETSLLIQAVRYHADGLQMPPSGRLPFIEIRLLERWVQLGAPWPTETGRDGIIDSKEHWAFQPLGRPKPPPDPTGWSANPVDAFILAKLKDHQLQPVALADRRTLIRRVTLDLTGLPPSWSEVQAFVNTSAPHAYEQLIERLLASPAYGERWGRHWLDLARYADTQGGSVDCPIPTARLYRDYVIDAFQADLPYDEFIRQQIAGDLLAGVDGARTSYDPQQVIATGFIALSLRNGIFKHYHPELIIEDTIDTIGRAILGMSIRCARCHDHKFEPISTADYYRLYGVFASSRYPFSGSEIPKFSAGESVPLIAPADWATLDESKRLAIEQLRAKISSQRANHQAQQELKQKQDRFAADVKRYHAIRARQEFDAALRTSIDDQDIRIREVEAKLDDSVRGLWNDLKARERAAGIQRVYAMREAEPRDSHVQVGGDPFDPGPLVQRGVPQKLGTATSLDIPAGASGRLQLARWITSHPLVPRVAVNYIWQFHFGRGIVATPDNFGLSGTPATHPELLEWLAREFVDSGWSVKHMHRLILLSKTYRLSSATVPQAADADPRNRWRWRFDRRRLDAESLRDGTMQVAQTLDRRRPGGHPFPPESSWQFSQHGPFKAVYDVPYRTVYLMTQRIQRHPFLALFDGADTSHTTVQRKSTALAVQALYLRNSPFMHQQSQAMARRLWAIPDRRRRVRQAVRRVWLRDPTAVEIQQALDYLGRYQEQWRRDRRIARKAELVLAYDFEGNAHDQSGGGRHGTVVGNPRFISGHSGQCISLDGDGDYIDSQQTMNELGDAFVVECWVRPASEQAHYADIFGNHLGGGRGFVLQQNGNATNHFRGSIGIGGDQWVLCNPVKLQTGQWHHIAMVRWPTGMGLYLNGKLASHVTTNAVMQPSPLSFRVGLGISIVERSFHGEIDEVRVYRGIPEKYRIEGASESSEMAAWSSYCRLLLTANEFLYVD